MLEFFCARHKKLAYVLLFMIISWEGSAQIKTWNHRHYTIESGLASNEIRNVTQDEDGFIWIATNSGLCRFDGDEFTKVFHDASDSTSLPSDITADILTIPNRNVLVSTSDGIFVMNPRTQKGSTIRVKSRPGWETYDNNYHNIYINTHIRKIIVLSSTAFLFFNYDMSGMEIIRYPLLSEDPAKSYQMTNYRPIYLPNGDLLFYDTHDKYSYLDYNRKKIVPFTSVKNHPYAPLASCSLVDCSALDSLGNLWFHRYLCDTLFCCPPNKPLIRYPLTGDLKNVGWHGNISFPERNKMVWHYRHHNNSELCELEYEKLLAAPGSVVEIKNHSGIRAFIYTITTDQHKNWWISCNEGLYYVPRNENSIQRISLPTQYPVQGDWQYVKQMYRLDEDHVLIAANAENIFLYNMKKNSCTSYLDSIPEIRAYSHALDMIIPLPGNRLLLRGSQDYTFQNLKLNRGFHPQNTAEKELAQHGSKCNYIDRKKNVWNSLQGVGLLNIDQQTQQYKIYKPALDFISNRFSCITEDSAGCIWFANGLNSVINRYDPKTKSFQTIHLKNKGKIYKWVNAMACGDTGIIFLAHQNGLVVYNSQRETFHELSLKDGLPSNIIEGLFYLKNHLFVSTRMGCMILDTKKFNYRILTENDGILNSITTSAFYFDQNERVLFLGGQGCLYKINVDTLLHSPIPHQVIIDQCKINNKLISDFSNTLILAHNENNVSLHVCSIDFESGQNKNYYYRLHINNQSGEWIPNKGKILNFINLAPGKYLIEIKSTDANNEWSKNTVHFSFEIKNPWFRTWAFFIFLISAIILTAYTLFRFRLKQLQKIEVLRNKLSRDLHDDIGSTLSSINLISLSGKNQPRQEENNKRLFEKISERSQRLLDNMKDIIWNIKPGHDNLEEVLARMREYAGTLFEARHIEHEIQFSILQKNVQLPMVTKSNLYLIFKEAVNNLAKYSECTHARITLECNPSSIVLEITDDGIGFDMEKLSHQNGLLNMKQRAEDLHASLNIISSPGKGTSVLVKIPR